MNARAPCARVFRYERNYVRVVIESEVRAREQCTSAAVNRGELEIVLPVDYEILGKCTYVRKKQDGVSSPKSPPPPAPLPATQ